ncbi:HK97 gp10 family phage protein [Streptomyces sp. NBC_00582]|uniref:HK97 gp10 family phage protein n=1 Tax=Streptomyces sp. NBC_00582 TaxID=2975783 RepID=UPI002E820B74|nr:HK97 gp10 family phage protein [Streptomyces sp. NBC_00582]WUB63884.1 HK97 gp10 family phage protein [Streptomyces sp. NBC_00582]
MVRVRRSVPVRMRTQLSATINTREYERGLRRYFGRMSDDVARAVDRTRMDVQNEARRRAPVDTGRLRSSIVSRTEGGGRQLGYVVGTNVNYAAAIEFGRGPVDIFPRKDSGKKALFWPGARHPVPKVHQKARAARPFLRPAIELTPIYWRAHASQIGRR